MDEALAGLGRVCGAGDGDWESVRWADGRCSGDIPASSNLAKNPITGRCMLCDEI